MQKKSPQAKSNLRALPFTKLHGLGNDFLVIDARDTPISAALDDPQQVRDLCARRRGVGADGVLLVLPPRDATAHARMQVINADGSRPQMCGNGIRCVAKFLMERDPTMQRATQIAIETDSGVRICEPQLDANGELAAVRVDMGSPRLDRSALPMSGNGEFIEHPLQLGSETLVATAVSMGNPHLVTFVDDEQDLADLATRLGPRVERHAMFPEQTNAEFARVKGQQIELWVWERGCGITHACGTGACATAVAARVTERIPAGAPIDIVLPGGSLTIDVAPDLSRVWMTGPAVEVFHGSVSC